MLCGSFLRKIGHLESVAQGIKGCGENNEVVLHPADTQQCSCQNPSLP